jgi:AraC-like DNA-binding protein/CheY-like chemotaxis protein
MEGGLIFAFALEERREPYHDLIPPGARCEIVLFKDALGSLKKGSGDLILLDCGCEFEEGLELLRDIKIALSSMPVVFITDIGSEEIAVRAFRLGARDYFRRPFDRDELRAAMQNIMRIKRASGGRTLPLFGRDDVCSQKTFGTVASRSENILRAIDYIEHNLSSELRLALLAKEANLSKYHFCRLFKRQTGMSPGRYIARLRIERAKGLLARADLNVSLTALESGFNDLSNFNREFKKHTVTTPSFYKNTFKD